MTLNPTSNALTLVGTNSTGTYVVRAMALGKAPYLSVLKVIYIARPDGVLKWDLDFIPSAVGHYALNLTLSGLTRTFAGSDRSELLQAYDSNYTLSWRDVPASFNTASSAGAHRFSLLIDLGTVSAGIEVRIDPSLVGNSWNLQPTYTTFQHRLYQDPKTGYYWVFYINGTSLVYKYSMDGITWNPRNGTGMPNPWPGQPSWDAGDIATDSPAVYFSGETVVAAVGIHKTVTGQASTTVSPTIVIGTLVGNRINWGTVNTQVYPIGLYCYNPTVQACWIDGGVRYVSVSIDANGKLWLSFDEFLYQSPCSPGQCGLNSNGNTCYDYAWANYGGFYAESYQYVVDFLSSGASDPNNPVFVQGHHNASAGICYRYDRDEKIRSALLSADMQGITGTTIIFQFVNHTYTPDYVTVTSTWTQLIAQWSNGGTVFQPSDVLEPLLPNNDVSFSAVSNIEDGTHFGAEVVYSGSNGNITYAHRSAFSGAWSYEKDIFGTTSASYPTITTDYSTNNVYAFAILSSNVIMRMRTYNGKFADHSIIYPVTQRSSPSYLQSGFASVSASNSSYLTIAWSESANQNGMAPWNTMFASIPIQTVWSPYASMKDPWNGNGLAPYGQYFQSLGEYVSPSTGMLTIRQTDLSVPGRGLSLDFTRVYAEPYSFLNGQPYNYETYTWSPMGDGWQFNFPWITSTAQPVYLHISNGQGYIIPTGFWSGFTGTFENHQGENFRLVRYVNGTIILFDKSGTSYVFGTSPSHALMSIKDSTGNNTITFSYTNNLISCVTDSVGRTFTLSYSGGLLQYLSQVSGTCVSPGTTMRRVSYFNNGQSLTSVTDPAGRTTYFAYNATSSSTIAPWLLARVRYPTSWLTNYTYTAALLGTQALTYRVRAQITGPSATIPSRQFSYSYNSPFNDQIINSTVTTYNGTRTISYTKYAFSFMADVKNVTDANGLLLSGDIQFFGVGGQIPKDITIVSDGQGHLGSYTNYYAYDLWGNQIYSRDAITSSPNRYHETFSSYYNNGEPPGFYAFDDSFSRNQGSSSDNVWNTTKGIWVVSNGMYNGTGVSGPEEGMVAYSNIGTPDISMQARVFLSRLANTTTDRRFGIFTHYAGGTLFRKWALVIHAAAGQPSYLELLDEWNQWLGSQGGQSSAQSSCSSWTIPLISTGVWYTFNMTVRGTQATGWVSAPGQSQCSVYGTFQSTSPAIGGAGFGLYAATYSALFDDVIVTTVSPNVTGTSFSNSFIQNGAPGPVGLDTWMSTTKPPGPGWNTTKNWPAASAWSQAYASQNYGGTPWGTLTGWSDNSAQWIWPTTNANISASMGPVWFRRTFILSTTLTLNVAIATDDTYVVYLDGTQLGTGSNWHQVGSYTSTVSLGFHVLAIYATNIAGPAGLLVSVKNTSTGQVMFRSDATAGPAIGALAGSAQLQNGSASLSEETYYGYTSSGELNQTRTRLDTNASPIFIDNTAQAGCSHSTNSCSLSFSTSQPNDIIIVFTSEMLDLQISCTFSVTDTAGLSWTLRGSASGRNDGTPGTGNRDQLGEFWAKSTNKLSSDMITESISGCAGSFGGEYNGLIVFGISGANFSNPFDSSSSLPGSTNGNSNLPSATISTSNSRDMVIGIAQQSSYGVLTAGPGFAPISYSGACCQTTQEDLVYSSVTNFNVAFGDNTAYYWEEIADAVQAGVGSSQTQWIATTRSYDQYGNLLTTFDPRGNSTSYAYSTKYQSAYLTSQTSTLKPGATSVVSSFGYNFTTGTMIWAQQPNGYNTHNYNTTYTYDILGRPTKVTYPTGDFAAYAYNDASNYVNVTNENGLKTKQIYDGLGRLVSTQRFVNGVVYSTSGSTYNWMNEVTSSTDPLGNRYSYTYDALGRMNMTIEPNGNHTQAFYNGIASWVRYADEYQNSRCNIYDRLGRLVSVIEEADTNCLTGIVTNYYYDEAGDLIEVRNANQAATFYTYDSLSRLIQTTNADGTTNAYVYDSNGNVVRKVNQNAVKTLLSYDSLSRLLTVTYCGSPVTSQSYTYDSNGNALSLQNQNSTVSYIYDSRNRVLNETYAVNPSTRQVVDLGCSGSGGTSTTTGGVSKTYMAGTTYNGELVKTVAYPTTSQTNPDITIKYAYDTLGRVLNATNVSTGAYYARLAYSKADNVLGIQYGNGLVGNYTYDKLLRTSTITLQNTGTHTTMMSLTYGYNNTGTVSSVVGQVNSVTVNEQYKYDPLQRLVNSTVISNNARTTSWYEYDNVGNRIAQSINGTATTYTYNQANNELLSSTSPGLSIVYAYDKSGNLLNKNVTTSGTVRWYYTWDVAGDLLKVATNSVQGIYAYDGNGRTVEAIEGGSNWFYAFAGTEMLYKNLLNSINYAYVFASGQRISLVDDRSSVYYWHTDALGSTRMMTYSDATVIFTDGYQPYGQDNGTPQSQGTVLSKFTGKPVSQTTGLYYYYSRWYDPSIGRFISQDSYPGHRSDPQSLNPYLYVENSPTTYSDPSGECPWCIAALIGAGIGAAVGYGWCVADTGGWTSSECGKQALEGAIVGGVIGLTLGLAAPDEGPLKQGADQLVNTADFWSNVESTTTTTTTIATDTTTSISASATPVITETTSAAQRVAANREFGISFENHVADIYGETRNVGPGQTSVANEFGTYRPDFRPGGEAKAVQYLSLTNQMKIAYLNAQQTGTPFKLYVLAQTELSGPMDQAAASAWIKLIRVPFPS